MSPLDNVTVLWAVVSIAGVLAAFGLGYQMGRADGLELRYRRLLRLTGRRR